MPWDVQLRCHFQEHTGDIEDNQILAWTLHTIARTGLCSERVLPAVRKAYRSLQGLLHSNRFPQKHCVKRLYHRLNEDYRPLHGLCRFFLEHTGPTNRPGDKSMLPFLINMALLFEDSSLRGSSATFRENFGSKPRNVLKLQTAFFASTSIWSFTTPSRTSRSVCWTRSTRRIRHQPLPTLSRLSPTHFSRIVATRSSSTLRAQSTRLN